MIGLRTLLLFFCLVLAFSVNAQRKKKIDHAKGEWVVSNDITPIQAREYALQQAKIEALRRAGVPEIISESNLKYHSEQPKEMKELFESLASVAISGEISDYKIVDEKKSMNAVGNMVIDVWIDATVIIHESKKDDGFGFEVKGVREGYTSPEPLVFDVMPWKDGYLTAFVLGDTESSQIYPNDSERQEKLKAQTFQHFPRSAALDYEVSTEGTLEVNYLVLLYTKVDIPFVKEPTQQNILKFIAGIDPAQKSLKAYSFVIKRQ